MRIVGAPDVAPVEDVFAEVGIPPCRGWREGGGVEPVGRRKREREERGPLVAGVAGPPTDLDLLGVGRVARDEVGRWRVDRLSGEQADGQVEAAPPGVDGRGAAPLRRPQFCQHERRSCGRREVFLYLRWVVGGVVVVLIERWSTGSWPSWSRSSWTSTSMATGLQPLRSAYMRKGARKPRASRRARSTLADLAIWAQLVVEQDQALGVSPLGSMPSVAGRKPPNLWPGEATDDAVRSLVDDNLGRLEQHLRAARMSVEGDARSQEIVDDIDRGVLQHRKALSEL